MKHLINYYIIHRESGISYNPDFISSTGNIMTATTNSALRPNAVINVKKLVTGLAQKRYRLIPKTV